MHSLAVRPCVLGACLALAACAGDPSGPRVTPIEELPRPLTVAEQAVIGASNAFGFDLFRRVYAADAGPNVFLSPLSASMALGMALNGARGDTWEGMRHALAFDGLSQQEINQSYHSLIELLTGLDGGVRFSIANSVWARLGFTVLPAFYETVRASFGAAARTLDFDDPAALDVINGWISDATNGLIREGIDQISQADLMFLINAIYFKGDWSRQFDRKLTRRAPFHRGDGSTVDVDLMSQRMELPMAFGPHWSAGELSYGGGAFGMIVVVPNPGVPVKDVVDELDEDGWRALVDGLQPGAAVEVFLPRFRIEYDAYLNAPLIAMGMQQAFSPYADFHALTPDDVCIQFVRQKTLVDVDERGTEAAAVTVVGIGRVSAPPALRADRPFIVAIRERLSGTILFIGAIGDPAALRPPAPVKPRPPC